MKERRIVLYVIAFKDEGKLVLSSKTFDQYVAAVVYAKTISPSREPLILAAVSCIKYDEETGEGTLREPMCPHCHGVTDMTKRRRFCPNCGRPV